VGAGKIRRKTFPGRFPNLPGENLKPLKEGLERSTDMFPKTFRCFPENF
jgi:hypothetical protein